MKKRFVYELIVGSIGLMAVFLFGCTWWRRINHFQKRIKAACLISIHFGKTILSLKFR
jgi:hypothetical protein